MVNYLNEYTPLERIANALESTDSTSSVGGTKTVIFEDVLKSNLEVTRPGSDYFQFFTPYIDEEGYLKSTVSGVLEVDGLEPINLDANHLQVTIDKSMFMSQFMYPVDGYSSLVWIEEAEEGGTWPQVQGNLKITLTIQGEPEPDKPGYMNSKTSLERIADALEKQIGEPSEDKGMLAEKDYLERMAVAVESGAGQGGGVTPTGEIEITENGTYDVSNYASANVEVGGADFEINDVTALFYYGARLDECDKYMNALSQAPTGAALMFTSCSSLTSLDLSNFNTSKVTTMESMFSGCSNLTSLDVSNWNTSNVNSMTAAFSNCPSLTSLDLSNFDFSNVTYMTAAFSNCSALTSLKIGTNNSNYSKITSSNMLFKSCSNLNSITINGTSILPITNSSAFTSLKSTCKFYVPDNLVDSYKAATNWSTRASYIKPLSEYVEG